MEKLGKLSDEALKTAKEALKRTKTKKDGISFISQEFITSATLNKEKIYALTETQIYSSATDAIIAIGDHAALKMLNTQIKIVERDRCWGLLTGEKIDVMVKWNEAVTKKEKKEFIISLTEKQRNDLKVKIMDSGDIAVITEFLTAIK